MYKTLIVLLVIGVATNSQLFNIERLSSSANQAKIGLDLCPTCINEAVEAINVLANLILDEGILATCGDLCGALANKTGSKVLGDVCDLVCDAVGIDEFIKILIKADVDPIWYCEIADMCPINDQGDAKFTNFGITPNTGRTGTEFIIDCSFTSKNGTGTGMLRLEIVTPTNQSATNDFLIEAKKPGTYVEKIGVKTDLSCDPSTGGCKSMPTGTYNVSAQLCNGECGSHHPHSSIYDVGKSSFIVTK